MYMHKCVANVQIKIKSKRDTKAVVAFQEILDVIF